MRMLIGNWWAFVLRGLIAVIFGILTFLMPSMALLTLVLLFGFYAITDGVFKIIAAFRRTAADQRPWGALLISGILGLIAGACALLIPGLTAIALLYVIAAWAVVTGAMEIAAAIRLRRQIHGEWLLALAGVLSIALGVLMAIFPGAGALTVVLWIGAWAIVFGVVMVVLGFELRHWTRTHDEFGHGFRIAPGH